MRRQCFSCNGTGNMCGSCGESVDVCLCEDQSDTFACSFCGGIGIAILDQTEKEKACGKKFRENDED